MSGSVAVLELDCARAGDAADAVLPNTISLRLMPGSCALVEVRDPARAAAFADLCCGLWPLAEGRVCFLGRDWAKIPERHAAALRGRIGRVLGTVDWIGFLDLPTNILLPQLHHTRRDADALLQEAAVLAQGFGLPGLPLGLPSDHPSPLDQARAACVRAFLGRPNLLLLESPLQAQFTQLLPPLLAAVAAARDRGAVVVWLTRGDFVWGERSFPSTHRMRLTERGLIAARSFA